MTDALDRITKTFRDEDPAFKLEFDRQRARAEVIVPLVEARRARGWTQRDLAAASGIQQPVIARLEAGDTDPKLSTVTRLAQALGLKLTSVPAADLRAG